MIAVLEIPMFRLALAASTLVLLMSSVACVSTRVSGRAHPGFRDARFQRLLVFCDARDEGVRAAVEEKLAQSVAVADLEVGSSLDLLTEPRLYTEEEVRALMARHGYDALMLVEVDDFGTDLYESPGGFSAFHDYYGYGVSYHPPQVHASSRLRLTLQVQDAATGRTAWSGHGIAASGSLHELEELAEALGRRVRDELLEDRVVEKRR